MYPHVITTRRLASREASGVIVMPSRVLDLDVIEDVIIFFGGFGINKGIEAVPNGHAGVGEDVLT